MAEERKDRRTVESSSETQWSSSRISRKVYLTNTDGNQGGITYWVVYIEHYRKQLLIEGNRQSIILVCCY